MKHPDGSVISQFFQTTDKPTSGEDIYNQGLRFVVGQVEKIYYVDDPANVSKKYVEYDVSIRDAKSGQSKLRNIRQASLLGGTNDYDEMILEANEFAQKGKLEPANFFVNKNGTTVIVAFIDGSKDKPFILAALQHPRKDGAKKSDGPRRKGEYRGLQWEISKDGEFTITHQGARGADGKLKSNSTNTVVKFDKDGNLTISDNAKDTIKLDNTNNKVSINAGDVSIEVDGKGDKVTTTTTGGAKIIIDGSGNITLEANATKIIINGSTGKISLTGNLIDVGEAASALAVLGPQLIAWLQSHTHMGDGGPAPGPTSPPLIPPPTSTLSTSVKIKA